MLILGMMAMTSVMAQTAPSNATVVRLGPGAQGCTGTAACNTTFQNINLIDSGWGVLTDPDNQPYHLSVKLKVTYKESGNGAAIKEDFHSLTDSNGANYFSGILTIGADKGTRYWITHNLAFVRSVNGAEVPVELAWPFWVSSMDTDGTGNTNAGVREIIEFGKGLSAGAALSPVPVFKGAHVDDPASTSTDINGTRILTTPALTSFAATAGSTFMPSGLVYGTKPCAAAETGDNALPVATYCNGNTAYPISDGVSLADWTKVTVGYPAGVSSFDFVYGGETMQNGQDFPDRKYAVSLNVLLDNTDMKPDAISCTPSSAQIGAPMTCTVVCRNIGGNPALFPSCNLKVRQPDGTEIKGVGGQCGTYQAVPEATDRLTQFGMLASQGALSCSVVFTPQRAGAYLLTGGTGAINDNNGGHDETKGNNPTSRTLTVAQPADMAASVTQWPAAFGPGQAVQSSGQVVRAAIRCTNVGVAAAIDADCTPSVSVGTISAPRCTRAGAAVALPLASLPPGAAVDCLFDYTAPGAQGGAAEPTLGITVTATAAAGNDGNAANNTASAVADVIDAIDDGRYTVTAGAGGQISLLTNDRLATNQPPLAGSVVATLTDNAGQSGLVLDSTGTTLRVPAGLVAATYPLAYRLCSQREPTACDTATVTVVIEPAVEPDLTVTKTHSPAMFTEGQQGDYSITVSNVGVATTQGGYTLVDTLPPGLTVAVLPSVAGWDCSATRIGSATLSCTSAVALAQGATALVVPLKVNVAVGACAAPDAGGICQGAAALVNTVTIGGGGESNLKNNTATDPTPLQKTGAVSGTVWIDANHNRVRDAGEPAAAGMLVEIWRSGRKLAETRADAGGNYRVEGLTPGSGFGVRFRDPGTGAYYGAPISKDPAGGNDPRANPTTGVVDALTIDGITVPPGATGRVNQSLPLDPSGVVYDSATRAPIAGAVVELLSAGSPVPGGCVVGGLNRLTTAVGVAGGVDGAYSFLLLVPAPTGCPGTADYQLRVTPPASYVASALLPPQASPLQPPAGCVAGTAVGLCAVQSQSLAPSGAEPTPYYLAMHLDLSGPQVVNNHIPLDPVTSTGLLLSKTADRRTAEIGDSVRYTITVKRTDAGSAALPMVEVMDRLPAGLRYIAGTARLASGSAATSVALSDPTGMPGPQLRFVLGSLPAGGTLVLSYRVRVDLGAPLGDGINKARATTVPGDSCSTAAAARTCSNEARHQLQFSDTGAFSSDACVVGKVFVDCNHNHVQDAEELGIPGVRLYLQDGTSLISDSQGKYSHCGLTPRTHVLGVDPTTLPRGSRLTTSSSRNAGDAASLFLDLKSGELHRADFIEGSCSNTVLEQVKARRARGEIRAAETEKRGGRVLKFDGKPVTRPIQATDSANQRGNAAGQGEPGAVKPRIDGGRPPPAGAVTDTRETLLAPVPTTPTSSEATQPDAPARQPAAVQP